MKSIYINQIEYREIPGSNGNYYVSANGECVSTVQNGVSNPRKLKQHPDKDGYMRIATRRAGNGTYTTVHQAVLSAWVTAKPAGLQARHLDGNKLNNSVGNLCWGTCVENIADNVKHGVQAKGERVWSSKMTEQIVLDLREQRKNKPLKVLVKENPQYSKFAIWSAITGYNWSHLPGAIPGGRKCTKQGWRNKKNELQVQTIPV